MTTRTPSSTDPAAPAAGRRPPPRSHHAVARPRRWLLGVGLAASSAVALATGLAGCTADPTKDETVSTTDTPNAGDIQRAEWDLSEPVTPTELGSRLADVASAETLGRDGVETAITLPGGDVVTGRFGLVTAEAGRDGTVATVKLASTQLHDGAWEDRIDGFVERFGGDRAAIDAYLATALPAMQAGEVDPGRYFPGEARPGYQPTLQLRPDEGGVVVNWQFNLTPS